MVKLPNGVESSSKQAADATCSTPSTFATDGCTQSLPPPRRLSTTYSALFEARRKSWLPLKTSRRSSISSISSFLSRRRYEYGQELGHGAFGVVRAAKLKGRLPSTLDLREDELDPAQLSWLAELGSAAAKEGRFTLRTKAESPFLFACKVVSTSEAHPRLGPSDARSAIEREAQMLDLCRGPRVLLLVEHFQSKGAYHIVTNRCYGTVDRRDDLAPRWIQAERARMWTAQLLGAVVHIHAKGVVHRDVKPANVFCTSLAYCPDVVLGDFGMATKTELDGRVPAAGSWGYWDVDSFKGYMTYRSDLWAVGVSALELCSRVKLHRVVAESMHVEASTATSAKAFFESELRAGFGTTVERCGLVDCAGLRPFLLACLDQRPSAELTAMLPDRDVAGTNECTRMV